MQDIPRVLVPEVVYLYIKFNYVLWDLLYYEGEF